MKELALKIVRNPGVRKAALALVLAVLAALGITGLSGCASFGQYTPQAQATIDRVRAAIECRADVLEPYLGESAETWVLEIAAGRVDPIQMLANLDLSIPEIIAIAEQFDACSPAEPEPAPAPATRI